MKCLVCEKVLEALEAFSDGAPAQNCWDSGLVEWIQAGYGSCFDTDKFLIGLCDTCIQEKLDQNLITRATYNE